LVVSVSCLETQGWWGRLEGAVTFGGIVALVVWLGTLHQFPPWHCPQALHPLCDADSVRTTWGDSPVQLVNDYVLYLSFLNLQGPGVYNLLFAYDKTCVRLCTMSILRW
jgi:hypothetical protein